MQIDQIVDLANRSVQEIGRFMVTVTLSPDQLMNLDTDFGSLDWDSISYGSREIDKVPDDKRGIYAFAVCVDDNVLPPHGYVMYVGMAGRDSNRSLRERYTDYLRQSYVVKRTKMARLIGNWHEVLRFYFVPFDDDVPWERIHSLERKLNDSLMPPFSEGDMAADLRQKRRAFI